MKNRELPRNFCKDMFESVNVSNITKEIGTSRNNLYSGYCSEETFNYFKSVVLKRMKNFIKKYDN